MKQIFLLLIGFFGYFHCHSQDLSQNYTPIFLKSEIPSGVLESYNKRKADINKLYVSDKIEKEDRDFLSSSAAYYLQRSFQGGQIYYNDTISNYVNKLADKILEKEPILRKEINIYLTKFDIPNATTFVDGTIFFNITLFDWLTSEDQIVFILCHEISHYKLKHSLKQIEYNLSLSKKKKNITEEDELEQYLKSLSFSRTQELEADKAGLEMYQKLGYDPQEALKTMDILEKINIDRNEKEVNLYSFLKIDSLNKRKMEKDSLFLINSTKIDTNKMAVEAIMDTLKAISMDTISKSTPVQITLNGNEKTPNDSTTTKTTKKKRSYYNWINTITTKTDTSKIDVTVTERKEEQEDLSTHPDTKERKDSLERFLLLDSIKHQNKQSVSLQSFNYLKEVIRFELINNYQKRLKYRTTLYEGIVLKEDYPKNLFIEEMLVKSLYWLNYYKNNKSISYNNFEVSNDDSTVFSRYLIDFQDIYNYDYTLSRQGLQYIEEANNRFPNSENINLYLGKMYLLNDDKEKGKAILNNYLKNHPNGQFTIHVESILKNLNP
jgi:predicted Zn-dependent protease